MIIQKSHHHILNSNKVENMNVVEKDLKDTGITNQIQMNFLFGAGLKDL